MGFLYPLWLCKPVEPITPGSAHHSWSTCRQTEHPHTATWQLTTLLLPHTPPGPLVLELLLVLTSSEQHYLLFS